MNMRMLSFGLLLMAGLILSTPGQAEDVSAQKLDYETERGDMQVYFSDRGIRYDVPETGEDTDENDHVSMLFSVEQGEPTLYVLDHDERTAHRITPGEIRELRKMIRRQMEQIEQMMENMPEESRRQMREQMGMMEDGLGTGPEDVPQTEFVEQETVEWKGLPAKRGILNYDGNQVGSGILLNEPPIELTENQQEMLERFDELLLELTGMASDMSTFEQPGRETPAFSMGHMTRLAEFEDENNSGELREWGPVTVGSERFSVPEDYSVRSMTEGMDQAQMQGMPSS